MKNPCSTCNKPCKKSTCLRIKLYSAEMRKRKQWLDDINQMQGLIEDRDYNHLEGKRK